MVILSVRGRLVRKFMLAAHDLGMTKGDYIFLDVEIFQVSDLLFKRLWINISALECILFASTFREENPFGVFSLRLKCAQMSNFIQFTFCCSPFFIFV